MDTTVSLDSFQLIIGIYFLFVSVKGSGTMYNFFDIPEKMQAEVRTKLRFIYLCCAVLALAEAGLCMWQGSQGYNVLSESAVSTISSIMSLSIVAILAGVFVWLRKLAKQ